MINITLSLVVKIKSYLSKTPFLERQNKFFWFMRTESQQTNMPNFPHKNKHDNAYALHHTRYIKTKKHRNNSAHNDSEH